MQLGRLIGSGNVAEVFEAGADVLKLYRPGIGKEPAEREIAIYSAVARLPLPVPQVRGLREVEGRWGVLMSRAPGQPLMDAALRHDTAAMATGLARLHRLVHAQPGAPLAGYKARLARNLGAAPLLGDRDRARLLDRLEALPDGDRLCHGDFHPANIIGSLEAPVIIDWLDASQGPAEADACRTYLLALHHMPDLAEPYLEAYVGLAGFSRGQVTDWLPVIAGARLAENIGAEAEKLVALSRSKP